MSNATRILRLLGKVFGSIGLAMALVAIGLAAREMLSTNGMLPTTGEVVAFQNRKPVVRFPVSATRSITVVGGTGSTPPAYDIGQQLRVFYEPANPQNAVIDTYLERWFVTTLFAGFAVLFGTIGAGMLIFVTLRDRRIAWLRRNGMKVTGRIVDVVYNRYVQLDRKPTWQIVADWSANGMSGRVLSFHLMQDPKPFMGDRSAVDIWVDPKKPKNAWMDTDFLDPRRAVAQIVSPVQRR